VHAKKTCFTAHRLDGEQVRTERKERKNNVGKCGNRNVLVREATVMGFQIPAHMKASNCAKYPTNNSTTVARTNTIIVPDEPCHVHIKKVCSHVPKKRKWVLPRG
jgi:hypothetical protein